MIIINNNVCGGDDGGGGDDEDVLQTFCQKSWYIMYCRVKAKHLCWKAFMKWIPLKTKTSWEDRWLDT